MTVSKEKRRKRQDFKVFITALNFAQMEMKSIQIKELFEGIEKCDKLLVVTASCILTR